MRKSIVKQIKHATVKPAKQANMKQAAQKPNARPLKQSNTVPVKQSEVKPGKQSGVKPTKHSSVRDKVINVAARLFYEQGYNTTGINQIVGEADIALGSLYNHFGSKTDLLLAYIENFRERWFAAVHKRLALVRDPKKKLIAFLDYRIENQQQIGYGGCALVKVNDEIRRTDTKVNEKIREVKDQMRQLIVTLVQQSGHLQILSDAAFADMVYLLFEGGLSGAAIHKDTKDLKIAKAIILQLL